MLEFLKKTPQKEAAMISKRYQTKADHGKKTLILSRDQGNPLQMGISGAITRGWRVLVSATSYADLPFLQN
jgi:hypothetical protein